MKALPPLFAVCFALAFTGCAQVPMKFPTPTAVQEHEVLGEGYGSAGGALLFGFIPIKYNSRFTRAQQAAIASKGGDALVNPIVTEKWWWAYIMNGATTTVTGTVIKLNK